MKRRILYVFLVVFLLADASYSFVQNYNQPLDGDLAGGIVPGDDVKPVMASPFGGSVIFNHQHYANPNRFFSHWMFFKYFRTVPMFLHHIAGPINSVYFSCAILKLALQLSLIFLLAVAVTGSFRFYSFDFILSAALITPLFQTNGFQATMGILCRSISFDFFYALPAVILIIYFLPLLFSEFHGKNSEINIWVKCLWIPLAFIVCLSGPLNTGVVCIASALLFLPKLFQTYYISLGFKGIKRLKATISGIPNIYYLIFIPGVILSLYSLYLGSFNSVTIKFHKPITELYLRMPKGFLEEFVQSRGYLLLFFSLGLNLWLIRFRTSLAEGKRILNFSKWVGIFAIIYISLLPFGGFRVYRPNILRFDTVIPLTIILMFVFGSSTLYLLKHLSGKLKVVYLVIILGILGIYTKTDKPEFENNKFERIALNMISQSKDRVVAIPHNYFVLQWFNVFDPKETELNGELMQIWGITKDRKLYFNK